MEKLINPSRESWDKILERPVIETKSLEALVAPILDRVKDEGDHAIKELTAKFDGVQLNQLLVSEDEIKIAVNQVSDDLKESIQKALVNIKSFHTNQQLKEEKVETSTGVTCWRESRPIEKVGLYIPGGTAPLFSTILMLAVPAKIAGCEEIVLCTPPSKDGSVHPAILYAASVVGVTKIFKVGGAQAIAAMAYGTESIPRVYKIFGPGNQFVTAAKQLISKEGIAIDMPAGPSEVEVVADSTTNAAYAASDLLSQAEHGVDSQVILVSTDEQKVDEIIGEVQRQLEDLPRKEMAAKSLANSRAIIVSSKDDVVDITNRYAPEHLIIQTDDYFDYVSRINNAGSVFLGHYTPESAGDYASGTNHTLPTNGFARAWSGVSLDSFTKRITFQEITKEGIQELGPSIEVMAEAEELFAHKNAVTLRLNDKN